MMQVPYSRVGRKWSSDSESGAQTQKSLILWSHSHAGLPLAPGRGTEADVHRDRGCQALTPRPCVKFRCCWFPCWLPLPIAKVHREGNGRGRQGGLGKVRKVGLTEVGPWMRGGTGAHRGLGLYKGLCTTTATSLHRKGHTA
jgi:hypothetical protein